MPNIEECLRRLDESKETVIDVETTGLDWRKNHIIGWVLTFGPRDSDSYYLPFRHAPGGNIEGVTVPQVADGWDGSIHPIEKEIVSKLNRPTLKIGHNIHFDLKFAFRQGLNFEGRFEDTMLNAALLNEWASSFSLDTCAKEAGVAPKKVNIYDYIMSQIPEAAGNPKSAMGHYWKLRGDDPIAVEYAASDGVSTWQLRHEQCRGLLGQGLAKVHDIECRLIPVLSRMMTKGVRIDEERLYQVRGEIEVNIQNALKALPEGFNSRSPSQVRKIMETAGHTDWPTTPKGAPSFPEQWLLKYPAGQAIIAVRKWSNLRDSFIVPMIETHLWNGRCHPEFNQLRGDEYGTITGRLSSSNPNLQQVSKRNKELGSVHRSIFAPDEGETWGSADFSQCEPRLLAFYSRSKVLLEGYRSVPSVDAHAAVAKAANIDRETGKRVNQTLITGGGKKVLCSKYGVAEDEVDKIWDDYFAAMPEVRTFQRRAGDVMRARGYVISLLGRRARLRDPDKSYTAVNRLLQCGNADIIKYTMVRIDDYLRSENYPISMLNNVHDSLDFSFNPDLRKHYERCLEIMVDYGPDSLIQLDVPMEVDAGEGRNWSEATWGSK